MVRYITIDAAPPPPKTARYSHAVEAGCMLYITGQLPIDAGNPDAPLPVSIESQTELVFQNLSLIARESGFSLSNTVFVRIYLSKLDRDYAELNLIYNQYFNDLSALPARTTVGVSKLGRNALVEIDLIIER